MTVRPVGGAVRALVLAVCLVTLVPGWAAAQQLGGGVKAGVTVGDIPNATEVISGSDVAVDVGKRVGFAAGGFLMLRFPSGFAIQPEFLYTQKGMKFTVSTGGASANAVLRVDFLDVPVLARYTFGKVVRGYVFGGPSFDFKLSAKAKMTGLGQSASEDFSSDVKSFEFAVVGGGGVELGPILLEARWSEGLTDLNAQPTSDSLAMKTRTLMVLGGLRF